jgi:hypothetical protein
VSAVHPEPVIASLDTVSAPRTSVAERAGDTNAPPETSATPLPLGAAAPPPPTVEPLIVAPTVS